MFRLGKTVPVTWADEKLILLYCPGQGSNSRPPEHRGFKHGQGAPRPYSLGHNTSDSVQLLRQRSIEIIKLIVYFIYYTNCLLESKFSKNSNHMKKRMPYHRRLLMIRVTLQITRFIGMMPIAELFFI